jgi:hypothetical protein
LDETQRKWHTGEKEAYAMVWALRHLRYELGNRKFILQTDHKNLLYINAYPSPKVNRWKMEVGEYDFLLEYIPGKENTVADRMSRLMEDEEKFQDEKRTEEAKAMRAAKLRADKKEATAKHKVRLAALTRSRSINLEGHNSEHKNKTSTEGEMQKSGLLQDRGQADAIPAEKEKQKRERQNPAEEQEYAIDLVSSVGRDKPIVSVQSNKSAAKRRRENEHGHRFQEDSLSSPKDASALAGASTKVKDKGTTRVQETSRGHGRRVAWKAMPNPTQLQGPAPGVTAREESHTVRGTTPLAKVGERKRVDISTRGYPTMHADETEGNLIMSELEASRKVKSHEAQWDCKDNRAPPRRGTEETRQGIHSGGKTKTKDFAMRIPSTEIDSLGDGQQAHVKVTGHHSQGVRDLN